MLLDMQWLWIPVVCLLWWIWTNRRQLRLYWKIGSRYPAFPFIGHGYLYLFNREQALKNLFTLGDHAISNGGLSTTWLLHRLYVVLADAVDAEYVLMNHLEKDEIMKTLRLFTRTSTIFATVPIWRPRRKIVARLLSHKNVSKFEPVFAKGSEAMARRLRPLANAGPFSVWAHFSTFTVDAVCTTVLGIDLKGHKHKLRAALNKVMDKAGDVMLYAWYRIDFVVKRTSFYKEFLKEDQVVKDFVEAALKTHETEVGLNDSEKSTLDEEQQFSLVHMFTHLKKQQGFDHTTLHDESLGLLIAASDTTAVSSALISIALAQRPHIQEKVYQELKEVFGESDRPVTSEDLPRLKYLSAVIKETQRLFPAVPHITRTALVDIHLPSGVTVPKGTNFLVSIYALHRNPKYWGADADQFRPERFLNGSKEMEQTAYFAFSYGPRGCPGVQYAMMSMKTVLATLLRQYRLLPAAAGDALRLRFGVTVMDADGFQVRIQAR